MVYHCRFPSIYLEREYDPNNRLLLVEIYVSNKNTNEQNPTLTNKAIDMMDYYLINSSKENIQQDLENIIARIYQISLNNFDKDKLNIINKSIQIIIDNIEPLLQYLEKLQNMKLLIRK